MPTSHYAFRVLPFNDQYATILTEGTFPLTRCEEEDAVHLYHMLGGFFAELHYDQFRNEVYRANAFTRGPILDDYLLYVDLPPLE